MGPLKKKDRSFPSLISDFFESDPFFNQDWIGNRLLVSEVPAANIEEKDNAYEVELAVPGMKKEDFRVTCEDGVLNIRAEREQEDKEEKKNYTRREYNYSSFSRTFNLPESVKADDVKAKYEDGVLRLTLPKKEKAKTKPKKEIKVS